MGGSVGEESVSTGYGGDFLGVRWHGLRGFLASGSEGNMSQDVALDVKRVVEEHEVRLGLKDQEANLGRPLC